MHIVELPISLYSFKLRLALRLKAATIALQPPPGGSYRSAEFALINPAGTIPTLVDGAFWLAESDAIIEHLDDLGIGRPLRPADLRQRAQDRMLSRWVDQRLEANLRKLFAQIAPAGRQPAAVAEADAAIKQSLALLEQGLDPDGPFATGAVPGLADCGLMASASWLIRLQEPLALTGRVGPRAARAMAAMAHDPRTAGEIGDYGARVDTWLKQRLSAQD
jgi:glutathione S-transferase/maleylpyruvate isomerase